MTFYMATIVTAFVTKINNVEFRSYEKYIELGKKLISQPIPTVCFLEKHIFDEHFSSELSQYPHTHFIIFEKDENYLLQYEHQLTDFYVNTDNPTKDTPGYMFTQCHKTEWIRMAIEKNPFETSNFVWVDFGIYHMIRNEMGFALYLEQMSRNKYDSIRIASCVDPNKECKVDIFRDITWFFAGSVFGGSAEKLVVFSKIMKAFCLEIIEKEKHLMWEINIWYLLHKQYPDLFSPYTCDHNLTILANY